MNHNRILEIPPATRQEIVEIMVWYAARRQDLEVKFYRSLELAIEKILRRPLLHAIAFGKIRSTKLRKFPYSLYYIVDEPKVILVAVYHTSRDSETLRERLG